MKVHADRAEDRGGLALTRLGAIVVAVEGARVTAFFEANEREADCDLAEILGVPAPASSAIRLLELAHSGGTVILAVRGRIRMTSGERRPRYERPALVAGIFRQACLRGVMRHESELVYLLDVEEIAARVRRAQEGRTA